MAQLGTGGVRTYARAPRTVLAIFFVTSLAACRQVPRGPSGHDGGKALHGDAASTRHDGGGTDHLGDGGALIDGTTPQSQCQDLGNMVLDSVLAEVPLRQDCTSVDDCTIVGIETVCDATGATILTCGFAVVQSYASEFQADYSAAFQRLCSSLPKDCSALPACPAVGVDCLDAKCVKKPLLKAPN
jgi:hypothetical protein